MSQPTDEGAGVGSATSTLADVNAVYGITTPSARAGHDVDALQESMERAMTTTTLASDLDCDGGTSQPTTEVVAALARAPMASGDDPTEWLPDELMVMIFLMVPFESLWHGVCSRVCRRWARLVESAPVQQRKLHGRWAAYEAGIIRPRELKGHRKEVASLAVGPDDKVYSGSADKTICAWSALNGALLYELAGHPKFVVTALAVGLDGKVYSGSHDQEIRVWSRENGTHLQTLKGHTGSIYTLAIGLDGKVYSGSMDATIRVWSGGDGTHLYTLAGHTNAIYALAIGLDGRVYSGSVDHLIKVWSGDNGEQLRTLEGHADHVTALAIGLDGNLYSGGVDYSIKVWSTVDGTCLRTIDVQTDVIHAIVVDADGNVYIGSDNVIEVRSSETGALLYSLTVGGVFALAMTARGNLFSASTCTGESYLNMW